MEISQILKILACPNCESQKLVLKSPAQIICPSCFQIYPLKNGVPIFLSKNITSHESNQAKYFDQHYRSFTEKKMVLEPWRQSMLQRLFSPNIPQGKTYLDIGCGATGYAVFESIRRGYTLGIGVDLSLTAISKAIKLSHQLKLENSTLFIVASFEKLPFKNNFFNFVSAVSVLEHTNNDQSSVQEINRVVKSHGHVFICVPNSYENIWFFLRPAYRVIDRISGHKRHYSLANLRKLLGKKFSLFSYVYNGHLVKIVQIVLSKLRLINSNTWWKLEKADFSKHSRSLQLNAIFIKYD